MWAMTSAPAFADVLSSFVQLVTTDDPPSLLHLARALDALSMLVHDTPAGKLSDLDVDPPGRDYDDYKALYDSLTPRFPELGNYLVAEPVGELPAEPTYGDAIDDLADIVADLRDVIWRCENVGLDEAHWYFHFHFEAHWGRHLRELSLYLHVLMGTKGAWDDRYGEEDVEVP